ncbi:MAG: ATP-binding protein [Acidobacteriota bacterium]
MSDSEALSQRRLERETLARREAESLLERKSLELVAANQELQALASELEERVRQRTEELLSATRERETAIQAQFESERQYRQLVESASDIIFRTDSKGRFTYVNPQMATATGHSAEWLIGRPYLDLVAPEHRDGVGAVLSQQYMERTAQSYLEFPAMTASGSTFWVGQSVTLLTDGDRIVGFQAVARDVTSRVLLEVKQRAQYEIGLILGGSDSDVPRVIERVLQVLCERTGWACGEFWLHDAATTTVTHSASWSEEDPRVSTFEEETRERQFRHGKGLPGTIAASNEVLWLPDLADAPEFVRGAGAEGAGLRCGIGFPITISGEVIAVVCLFARERRDYDGDMLRLAASVGNHIGQFVERCRVEERLAASRDAALEASRLKSEFLATMSHEIRTPMNGVIGTAELLRLTSLSDEQRDLAETIQASAGALLRIIDDILDFSKIEAGKMHIEITRFDLVATVQTAAELLAAQAKEKSLTLTLEIGPGVRGMRRGDPNRIRQVVLNLVGNAIKFTERGGVRVRIHLCRGNDIRFEIVDTGIGLSEIARKRLFQPFTQADGSVTRKHGGTGLGLSISRRLVELMGGRMGMESTEGEGSKFWFLVPLPLCEDETSEPDPGRLPSAAAPRREWRILVAEDNATNQKVIARQLAVLGFPHELAVDGRHALAMFVENPYDLVLMDCHMPEMDGFTATRLIRAWESEQALPRRVPIIALTANAMPTDRARCLESGMDDHVAKPVQLQTLSQAIERWLPREDPTALMLAAPALDASVIDELRSLAEGDPSFLAEVATLYVQESATRLAHLQSAAADADLEALATHAHALRGSSANVGALEVAEACRDLEHLPAFTSAEQCTAAVENVQAALTRAAPELTVLQRAAET